MVRSSDLLKGVLNRLGLLNRQTSHLEADSEESDIVEITLGNAEQVFTPQNRLEYYCFAIRGEGRSQVTVYFKINQNPLGYYLTEPSKTIPHNLIDFQIFKYKYSPSKDPPQ